jgi:hypothetical protein
MILIVAGLKHHAEKLRFIDKSHVEPAPVLLAGLKRRHPQ